MPGRGNSSPIVWGDRIFLTTGYGNGERLSMLAYSRADGKKLWETFIPQNGVEYVHYKNGFASATPATDGQLVYASFGRHGLFAFDFNGKIVWQHKFGIIDNYHGPAGSPVLYKDRIFIFQDANPAPGQTAFVGAFDKATGKPIWQTPRRESVGWGTAVVINTGERDELIVSSQYRVAAYDPETGKELWTVRGNTYEVIPTPVVGHGLVFASSGRAGPTIAIGPAAPATSPSTHVAWSSPRGSPFVPSGIVVGDLLYLINDMQSILTVYEAATGKLVVSGSTGHRGARGILRVAGARQRQDLPHERRWADVRRRGGAGVQAAARERARRADAGIAGARRRHLVLANRLDAPGDSVICTVCTITSFGSAIAELNVSAIDADRSFQLKIDLGRLAGDDGDLLRRALQRFMPHAQLVGPRRHVVDRELPVGA